MPVPANRTPIRVARGNLADLQANIAALMEGEACWAEDLHGLYVVEEVGTTKTLVPASTQGHSGTAPPSAPVSGTIWIDSGAGSIKVYDGTNWRVVAMPVGPTVPTGPVTGDLWYDQHVLKVYDAAPSSGTPGAPPIGFVPVAGNGLQAGNGVVADAATRVITGIDEGTF